MYLLERTPSSVLVKKSRKRNLRLFTYDFKLTEALETQRAGGMMMMTTTTTTTMMIMMMTTTTTTKVMVGVQKTGLFVCNREVKCG